MIDDLNKLVRLVQSDEYLKKVIRCEDIAEVEFKNEKYSLKAFTLGSENPQHPVLFITGGIHGLERIGAQLAWSLLKTTIDRMIWDKSLQLLLQNIRLVVVPLVNPVGYYNYYRSNGNGVDLMRNSPVKAIDKAPFLLGGHRISNKIPWYQGIEGKIETENQAVIDLFKTQAEQSRCVVSMDFHSGFGMKDRLWFPFSNTKKPFDDLYAMHSLTHLFEQTHPYHIYQIEPQSEAYLLNGDLWDFIYLEYKSKNKTGIFLPLTLEMGSWTWVRKNPLQIFYRNGIYNPIKQHRIKRTYRRHHLLFDFLLKAINSNEVWSTLDQSFKDKHRRLGLERWYEA